MSFWSTKFGFIKNNLVVKIIAVIFILTWVPVLVILAYSTAVTKQSFVRITGEYFATGLENFSTTVDQKLFNLQSNVSALSNKSEIVNYFAKPGDTTQLKKVLEDTAAETGPWRSLYVTDTSGNILATSGVNSRQVGESMFLLEDTGKIFRQLRDNNQTVADIPQTDGDASSVALLKPVTSSSGKVLGYAAGVYELTNINSLTKLSAGDRLVIYNKDKQIVLLSGSPSTDEERKAIENQFQKKSSSTQSTVNELDGHNAIVVLPSFSSGILNQLDWRIVGTVNTDRILSEIDAFRGRVYLITLFVLFVVDVILVFFLRWLIVKPLNNVKDVAQQIAAGNYQKRAEVSNRSDVIGRLQYAINDMAMSLINEHYNLEKKVDEQTHQLSEKVEDLEKAKTASVNLLEDLSRAKNEIEQSKNKDDALLSSIGDGVFALDVNHQVILFNKAASHITGYSEQEVLGHRFDEVLKFEVRSTGDKDAKFIEKSLSGKAASMPRTTYLKRKDGRWVPVADSSSPVMDNSKVIGAIVVFRDITKDLEIETTKNEFVSLASHQLRTPLTAIGWYTELLLKDEHNELQGDQKKYLKEVAVGNRRMIELVNALLNLSRLELGTVAVEPKTVKLSEVVTSVSAELSHELKMRKQTIKVDIPDDIPQFKSDPQLLRIIIQNLMSNAIKYTPTQGHIELKAVFNKTPTTMQTHKLAKNTITISVKDNGFGIPKSEEDKIFTKLYRATNIRTKNTDGTGLGLYMVKMLCGILKSKIWFDSHEGKGSTFYINIPANAKIVKSGSKQLEP